MITTPSHSGRFDVAGLASVVFASHEPDALRCQFDAAQLEAFASIRQQGMLFPVEC